MVNTCFYARNISHHFATRPVWLKSTYLVSPKPDHVGAPLTLKPRKRNESLNSCPAGPARSALLSASCEKKAPGAPGAPPRTSSSKGEETMSPRPRNNKPSVNLSIHPSNYSKHGGRIPAELLLGRKYDISSVAAQLNLTHMTWSQWVQVCLWEKSPPLCVPNTHHTLPARIHTHQKQPCVNSRTLFLLFSPFSQLL